MVVRTHTIVAAWLILQPICHLQANLQQSEWVTVTIHCYTTELAVGRLRSSAVLGPGLLDPGRIHAELAAEFQLFFREEMSMLFCSKMLSTGAADSL